MFWPSMLIAPRVELVEAQDQIEDGRFAAARGADQRGHLPGLADETQVLHHGFAGPVGEAHVAEFDPRRA